MLELNCYSKHFGGYLLCRNHHMRFNTKNVKYRVNPSQLIHTTHSCALENAIHNLLRGVEYLHNQQREPKALLSLNEYSVQL